MTSTIAPGSEPDDARLREVLRLASVPRSDDIGPAAGPGAAGWDIATTADRLGVSAHTLRYYERIGLVRVGRDASGYRRYDATAVRRLVFLTRMRTSGMTISDLQRYVDMVEAGRDTIPERLAMLTEHRDGLRARIDELRLALAATDYKIAAYTRELKDQATADGTDDEATEASHSSLDSATYDVLSTRGSNGRPGTSRLETSDSTTNSPTHQH